MKKTILFALTLLTSPYIFGSYIEINKKEIAQDATKAIEKTAETVKKCEDKVKEKAAETVEKSKNKLSAFGKKISDKCSKITDKAKETVKTA